MKFLAICLCPWARAAKLAGTIPRVLADDLMVFVTGADAHNKTAKVLIDAHEFILDLRGTVKVEKTWAFTSSTVFREALRRIRFANANTPCAIAHEHRELGGHIDTTTRGGGTTLTKRASLTAAEIAAARATSGGATRRAL